MTSVGVSVVEGFPLAGGSVEGGVDLLGRQRRGKRHVPAGDSLRQTKKVGDHAFLFAGEQTACPTESHGNLV